VLLGIAIILALSIGGDDEPKSAATTTPTSTSTSTTAGVQTTPTGDKFRVVAQGTLAPPKGGDPDAKGQVAIVVFPDNNQYRFALQATGLPPSSTRGSAYGVWLYTSKSEKQFLGYPNTRVGADGKLKTVSDLAPDTPTYREVLLTRETRDAPKSPGTIILRGRLVTAAAQNQGTATTTTPSTGGATPTTTTP
jgi:hypothetical protein